MGLARRRRHNPWIAAAASWRMQRFQSRYCRYVDARGLLSLPLGRRLLVSENASSKAFIWSRSTRQALTASLRSILGVRWGCSVHSATYCGLVIGRAARPRGSMRPSSNRSDAAVVPVVAVVVSRGVGDRSRLSGSIVLVLRRGGVLAPYKVRSAAPAEGLPRARRPGSVERRRRGARAARSTPHVQRGCEAITCRHCQPRLRSETVECGGCEQESSGRCERSLAGQGYYPVAC